MPVKCGYRGPGHSGRGRAGSLPVLRWLRIGAATAGLGMALVAAPAVAQADTGTASSSHGTQSQGAGSQGAGSQGADSQGADSQGAGSSSDADSSPGAGADSSAGATNDSTRDVSDGPAQDPPSATGEGPAEEAHDETGALAEDTATQDDGPVAETSRGSTVIAATVSNASDVTATVFNSGGQGAQGAAASRPDGSFPDDGTASSRTEPTAPDSIDGQPVATNTSSATTTKPVVLAQTTLESPVVGSTGEPDYPALVSAPVTWRSILTESLSLFGLGALAPYLPVPQSPVPDLIAGIWVGLRRTVAAPADSNTATVESTALPVICGAGDDGCTTPPVNHSPKVTVHNNSEKTIWVYNLTNSGNYSITDPPVVPVSIAKGASKEVTLAVGTGKPGDPQNRIYIVEGDTGFTLPVASSGGVDPFNPTAVTAGNSFHNYSFVEYFLYPANGGYEYTIDTSYIDEWSLPIQSKFTIPDGVHWTGAVSGTTYGFKDFDTVVKQLTAAGAHMPEGGPYKDLVWSGTTPWSPYPPDTVSRIIGPDKVWAEQSQQPASNFNMNNVGWVPTSYQDFVQYGAQLQPAPKPTIYPYAYNGNEYSTTQDNFDFWRYEVAAPSGTPYPIALRTSAKLDGFPGVDGVWGFFTYPNDETAGQFTNIPTSVSMDIYVHGSADGVSDSVIDGGRWLYSSSPTRSDADLLKPGRNMLVGTDSTDTFILDYLYRSRRSTPLVIAQRQDHDIVAIDKTSLQGAISNNVDIVDCFLPWGVFANYDSQFIYDRSSGLLYYDKYPDLFGYTGILANLSLSQIDPSDAVFVL